MKLEKLNKNIYYVEELSWAAPVFTDRREAGELLARILVEAGATIDIVFGLAAGGVPVALEAAKRLRKCLDIVVVKKITYPWTTEAGFGAVALDGTYEYDPQGLQLAGYSMQELEERIREIRSYVERRTILVRGTVEYPKLDGKETLIVDDGIATGYTMRVAVKLLKNLGAKTVNVAAPTASIEGAKHVAEVADKVYIINMRQGPYYAVADAYIEWHDVTDQELVAYIDEARKHNILCPWVKG